MTPVGALNMARDHCHLSGWTPRKKLNVILMRLPKKVTNILYFNFIVSDLKKLQQKRLKVNFVDDDDDDSSKSI